MIYGALILAAGLSSRMGAFKPLIRINGVTIIDYAIDLFSFLDADKIIVVGGSRFDDLSAALETGKCSLVCNPDYNDGMFSSVRVGAAMLQNRCDAFFLLPCDMPFVKKETLDKISGEFINSGCDVCIPSYRMRGGHPPLISGRLIAGLLSYGGDGGMKGFMSGADLKMRYVSVTDEAVLTDLDTPEDLQKYLSD